MRITDLCARAFNMVNNCGVVVVMVMMVMNLNYLGVAFHSGVGLGVVNGVVGIVVSHMNVVLSSRSCSQ